MGPRFLFGLSLVVLVALGAHDLRANDQSAPLQGPPCAQDFPTAAAPDPRATVVMCGLDSPRGLALTEFALYVAEAGRGGLGVSPAQCFTGQAGGTRCYGANGAISRLSGGIQKRIATGFPSHANLQGRQAIGPNDIAVGSAMEAFVTIGLQQPPDFRTRFTFLADFAKLARMTADGVWSYVADLGAYETENDPDQIFFDPPKLDSNPYGLIATGRSVVVADAGGNSMVRVIAADDDAPEMISTVAVFPPLEYPTYTDDAVPTSVAFGPDGAYYVGQLTGFPLVVGAANIFRVDRSGGTPEVCLSGFTQIMDLAFDDRTGDLYVLQFQGSLVRISPERLAPPGRAERGTCARYAAGNRATVVNGLTNPTSVEVGRDGSVYVSNRGIFPGTGQVIRFELGAR